MILFQNPRTFLKKQCSCCCLQIKYLLLFPFHMTSCPFWALLLVEAGHIPQSATFKWHERGISEIVFWLFHFIAVFQKVKSNSAGSRVYETSQQIATTGEVTRPNLSHTVPVVAIRWLVDFVYSRFCRIQFNLAVYEWINSAEFESVNLILSQTERCKFRQIVDSYERQSRKEELSNEMK